MAKKISILGSTGSIGVNTLGVIDTFQDEFDVVYLSTYQNNKLIIEQAKRYRPKALVVVNDSNAEDVKEALEKENIEILIGRDGLLEISKRDDIDLVMNGLVGSAGMEPTINALKAGVDVALSNKESMVMAGDLINHTMNESGAKIYPVDSEHSAIWQCLIGENKNEINKLILTGSGGPFRKLPLSQFNSITKEQALNHPNWDMGSKITIDSATMMNKGFEIIEAYWLFNLPIDKIKVIIHPQSIIHSMVEFIDGSIKAQLGTPNMTIPINFALNYPNRTFNDSYRFDFLKSKSLTFEEPDFKKFKCIKLAYDAIKLGGTYPTVLNVSNDIAVRLFLKEKISFIEIPELIDKAMNKHIPINNPSLENILEITKWTEKYLERYN